MVRVAGAMLTGLVEFVSGYRVDEITTRRGLGY
jgi:hypothetical protein